MDQHDKLLRKTAHDLMNCLAPIRNALRLLEHPEADAATAAYARGLIAKQIEAMEQLCEALGARQAPSTGRSILIVDDNREWTDSLARVLRAEGFTVYTAYSGRRAVEIAEDLKPDTVVLDIEMPEVSGYEAARQLRRRLRNHSPTLIALTAWAEDVDKALARQAGFDHHLAKPAAIDELVRLIAAPRGAGSSCR